MIYLGNTPVGIGINNGIQSFILKANDMFYYGQNTSSPKPTVPSKVSLDLPACLSIQAMFSQFIASEAYAIPIEEVSIKLNNPVVATNFARRNTKLKKVVFPNGLTITSTYYEILVDSVVESVIGAIDFYSPAFYSTTPTAFNGAKLKDIEFVPNCIVFDTSFSKAALLTDDSVVSIANGLNESETGKTLTMESNVKTRMQGMIGNSTVPTGKTYHVFVPDANGSTNLADFVTNVKGWALA